MHFTSSSSLQKSSVFLQRKMGSDDKAVITGFICRLCSRMNRFVVHIYGDEGLQMQLAQKINIYLPITVSPNDPLPKTVCIQCIDSLEAQHELMEQFKWARQRVQRLAKVEHAMEDCDRNHSPRPPDEIRSQQMAAVRPPTPDINRSSGFPEDDLSRNLASQPSSSNGSFLSSTSRPTIVNPRASSSTVIEFDDSAPRFP